MHKPYSIGNIARLTGVPAPTLRLWERQKLIFPGKSAAGHRYYSQEDVERVQRIKRYRHISGMSIASVRQQLRRDDGEFEDTSRSQTSSRTAKNQIEKGKMTGGEMAVGVKVRQLRKQMGWSIRQLAERSTISPSQLSTFERGHGALGLARLNVLAMLFGKSLAELLGGTDTQDFPLFRRGTGRIVEGMGDGVRIEQVTVAERLMDVEFWTVEPGGQSDGFYSHEGEEFLYVIEGEFELTLASSGSKILHAGESAYFSSRLEHRWRNVSSRPATLLWINTDSRRLASLHIDKAGHKTDISTGTG